MLKTLVTTGVAAASVLVASGPAAAAASTCGTLPATVQGNPNVRAGQAGDAYLFHDASGWKLRVTHPGTTRVVVSGTVTATRGISHVTPAHLEKGDAFSVSGDGHTLSFRMVNVGHLDGLDFTAECSHAMRVNVRVNGHGASTRQVFLGAHRVHPTSVPFTIERH
jgi:hypothetical protein